MRRFFIIAFALVLIMVSACSENKNHPVTNIPDSLNALDASVVVMDSKASQSSKDAASEKTADSAAISAAAKVFGFSPDSASFARMKDSMLSTVKSKPGKNAGLVDSMMSTLTNLSTATSAKSTTANDTARSVSVFYHEALLPDYVIPITGSGSGFYYEYVGGAELNDKKSGLSFTITVDPAKTSDWNVYFDGHMQMQQFGINTHLSFLMNHSFTHVELNDDHKVYITQTAQQEIQKKNYSVTGIKAAKIGNEKLHGFNCVHARITAVTHFMRQTQNNEFDIWRSEEVPGASSLESSIQVLASPFTLNMEDQLVKMGCKGAIVKIEFNEKSSVVRKELFKITKKNVDDSIFIIPYDYKQDKNTSLYTLIPGN